MSAASAERQPGCELCAQQGGTLIAQFAAWRVVRVEDAAFPCFYRVISTAHVAEWTDLTRDERIACMDVLAAVEQVLRKAVAPTKVNLASLGNVVPHLHWHVVARFDWDSHFPQPIWAAPQRSVDPPALGRLPLSLEQLDAHVRQALDTLVPQVAH